MNKDDCIKLLIDIIQDSEYYESDRGTIESYEEVRKRNVQVLDYIVKNLK